MTSVPVIFCAPEFQDALQENYPGIRVIPFVLDCERCADNLDKIESIDVKEAWILFQPLVSGTGNHPVKDHINLSTQNPLIGPANLDHGPRFPDMSSVYVPQDEDGVIAVLGDDIDLNRFSEPWVAVNGGVWEALALKHRGYKITGWVVNDLQKWINHHLL